MLENINITVEADSEAILGFAISKGYERKTPNMDYKWNDKVEEYLKNKESARDFLKRFYEKPIKEDLKDFIKENINIDLIKKREREDLEIDKEVEKTVSEIVK